MKLKIMNYRSIIIRPENKKKNKESKKNVLHYTEVVVFSIYCESLVNKLVQI